MWIDDLREQHNFFFFFFFFLFGGLGPGVFD